MTVPGRLARVSAVALVGLLTQVPTGAGAASPEASASPGASASPAASASAALPVVRLVHAGEEPRSPLRYRYVPGTSATMTMDMDTTIAMGGDDPVMPSYAAPTMRVVVETTAGERTPAGTTRLEYRYLDAGVVQPGDGFADAFLDGWLDQYVGITMWSLVDDRGQAHGGGIEGVGQLDPLLASAFEDIETSLREASAPFPVEPVGVGARWAVEQSFASQGLDVTQRISYTLLDRGSDWVELGLESTLSAEPGPSELIEYPGTDAWVSELSGTGSGTMRMSLDGLTTTMSMESTGRQVADVDGSRSTTETSVTVRVRPGRLPIGPEV
jgi:hypothetical protein